MEEIRLRVCRVLILCTTIVQNVLVSKWKKRVVLCVDVRGCKNPHGQRPDVDQSHARGAQKRKRDRHDSQAHPLRGKKTTKFMNETSEEMTTGTVSDFEYLLISAIIHYSYPEAEDWTDVDSFNTHIIVKTFEAIRNFAQLMNMQLPIFRRNQEIEKALKHYKSQFDVFYKLYILSFCNHSMP